MTMKKTELAVPDIICRQCDEILTRALRGVPGVDAVRVDISGQRVEVTHDEAVTEVHLADAIEEEDYFVANRPV